MLAARSAVARLASRRGEVALLSGYSRDDRHVLALLLAPFFIAAFSLGISQTLRPAQRLIEDLAAVPMRSDSAASRPASRMAALDPAVPAPRLPAAPVEPGRLALPELVFPSAAPPIQVPGTIVLPAFASVWPPLPPALPGRLVLPVLAAWPPAPPHIERPGSIVLPELAAAWPPPAPHVSIAPAERLAPWTPPAVPWRLDGSPPEMRVPMPEVSAVCRPAVGDGPAPLSARRAPSLVSAESSSADAASFGRRLAAAARTQGDGLVVYSARYQRIAYPMGDVAPLHGACTDVVIRAYRAMGIDLQELVQRLRVGSGDANIDHRRTETLRRFFSKYGQSLPISAFPEDYQPGDVVTYHRPFSRVSRSHIAVVSDVLAATGRPMIIHNRGWGVQLEDALFVDRITGHYRYAPAAMAGRMVSAALR
jgi:hypothetical protein